MFPSAYPAQTKPSVEKYPYLADLDLKQHWREWQQVALPIFVLVAAGLLVAFLVLRSRQGVRDFAVAAGAPARVDLLAVAGTEGEAAPPFDPAFLVASPLEMARAPVALRFDRPEGHEALEGQAPGGSTRRVFATADGLALFAGEAPASGSMEATSAREDGGRLLVLLHRLPEGGFVQSRYEGIASLAVPVGRQVRRGDAVGTVAAAVGAGSPPLSQDRGSWRFEIRRGTAFGEPTPPHRREAAGLATEGFLREHGGEEGDPPVPPVRGEALESGILRLNRLEGL